MSLKEKSQSCISPCQYPIFKNFEYHEPKRKDQSYIISMPSSHLPLQAFFAILPDGENFDGNGWSSARSVLFWICCASFSWHSPTCSFFTRCPSVPLLFSRLLWVCGLFQLSSALFRSPLLTEPKEIWNWFCVSVFSPFLIFAMHFQFNCSIPVIF